MQCHCHCQLVYSGVYWCIAVGLGAQRREILVLETTPTTLSRASWSPVGCIARSLWRSNLYHLRLTEALAVVNPLQPIRNLFGRCLGPCYDRYTCGTRFALFHDSKLLIEPGGSGWAQRSVTQGSGPCRTSEQRHPPLGADGPLADVAGAPCEPGVLALGGGFHTPRPRPQPDGSGSGMSPTPIPGTFGPRSGWDS